ncbi:hypothetical protein M0208_12050 [Sphingomonas sp. SUN019]|uniref:hypothetical protein n=1 Tax=Sphingomonas sp. SUN019 TaxID=2937788 RepID=UPI0021645BE0|nr:hypothetical protein [Sphingomonas sp. SUN019]UVO51204.1 hypothetical protein M0208_12050 [Sphingomonas sp. SUN019]
MKRVLLGAVLLLGGCGAAAGLKPAEGDALPVAPYGATAPPTPADLLTPSSQARPQRNDELLRQSELRRTDEFDLPPN